MANFGGDDIDLVITGGIVFRGGSDKKAKAGENKIKTKAKKKSYITGAHGSGAAKMKAEIRQRRAVPVRLDTLFNITYKTSFHSKNRLQNAPNVRKNSQIYSR